MLAEEEGAATELTNATINMLNLHFQNHTQSFDYFSGDLEFIVLLTRGFLNNYETLTSDHVKLIMNKIYTTIFASTEVVYAYESKFYDDYFKVMDELLGKIHFEIQVKRNDPKMSDYKLQEYIEGLSDIME